MRPAPVAVVVAMRFCPPRRMNDQAASRGRPISGATTLTARSFRVRVVREPCHTHEPAARHAIIRRRMHTAFASHDELDPDALSGAPVRWPRPSRLEEGLRWKPRPAAEAAETLGLTTVGALLEHLPRESGEARTVAELA